MSRHVAIVFAALIALMGFIGSSHEAKAGFLDGLFDDGAAAASPGYSGGGGCAGCGPVAPVYRYKVVNKVSDQVRYRDVRKNHYVHKNRYIYNVTRVRHIVRVHNVVRVHHYDVPVIHNVVVNKVEHLPTRYVSTSSVQNIHHGCGCH